MSLASVRREALQPAGPREANTHPTRRREDSLAAGVGCVFPLFYSCLLGATVL